MNIREIAKQAGFRGKGLETIVAIVQAESGGNARAHNGNRDTGDNSYGLAQINMLGAMGPERRKQYGLSSNADLFDPLTNLKVAFKMSGGGRNFSPWSTYKSGAYQQFVGQNAAVKGGGAVAKGAGAAGGAGVDAIDAKDMAAQYGWALSVLKSDPSLYKVFRQAVANTWSPQRFVAELRGTDWFRQHSAAARKDQVLKATDPAEWKAQHDQARAKIRDMAAGMGAQLSDTTLKRITRNALTFGWADEQIRDTLAPAVKAGSAGTFGGDAATEVAALRQTAYQNGVKIADPTLQKWVQRMASGESPAGFDQYVRTMAKSAFPSFAQQIDAGVNVQDLAEPYINSMAQTLELDPAAIDLFDPTVRKALQATDGQGKLTTKPLWQFEDEMRADPRYDKTKQANAQASKFAAALTQTFGAAG